jgi:hypothetical protein
MAPTGLMVGPYGPCESIRRAAFCSASVSLCNQRPIAKWAELIAFTRKARELRSPVRAMRGLTSSAMQRATASDEKPSARSDFSIID